MDGLQTVADGKVGARKAYRPQPNAARFCAPSRTPFMRRLLLFLTVLADLWPRRERS